VVAQLGQSGVAGPKGEREFRTLLQAEFKRWRMMIPKLGIKVE
jgi:hypothetical protein